MHEIDTCPECGLKLDGMDDISFLAHVGTHEEEALARLVDHFARKAEYHRRMANRWRVAMCLSVATLVAYVLSWAWW